jgi:hypothetical protein
MLCPHPDKTQYASMREAWWAIEEAQRSRRVGADLKPYACVCGAIHLGHSQSSLTERIRKALGRD